VEDAHQLNVAELAAEDTEIYFATVAAAGVIAGTVAAVRAVADGPYTSSTFEIGEEKPRCGRGKNFADELC
jgi:hypothetical protein